MARRWSQFETDLLVEIRRRLSHELSLQIPFPEVVGDRRLLRFIRGLLNIN